MKDLFNNSVEEVLYHQPFPKIMTKELPVSLGVRALERYTPPPCTLVIKHDTGFVLGL